MRRTRLYWVTLLAGACASTATETADLGAGSDAAAPADASTELGCAARTPSLRFEEVSPPAPPDRWGHVAGYDAKRDRVVTFGGTGSGGRRSDVWTLGEAWSEWTDASQSPTRPTGRFTAGAVMDPERDRWIVMTGDDGVARDDVWALALDTGVWAELPKGPSARFDVAAALEGRRAWFYAGFAEGFVPLDDLWELDLDGDTWRELPTGPDRPSPRTNCAMGHHEGFLYVIGGHDDEDLTADYWRYELAAERWEPVEGPALSAWAHFAYTRGAGPVLWMAGGDNDDFVDVSSTWRVTLGSPLVIDELPLTGAAPPTRRHATLSLRANGELVLYGGSFGKSGVRGDTWRGVIEAPRCD